MSRLLAGGDLAALTLATGLTVIWSSASGYALGGAPLLALMPALGVVAFWARGMYRPRLRVMVLDDVADVLTGTALAAMLLLVLFLALGVHDAPGALVVRLWLLSAVAASVTRILVLWWRNRARRREQALERTLIVGAGLIGQHVARRLAAHPEYGLLPVGFLDADPPAAGYSRRVLPVLGAPDDMAEVARQEGASQVILAFTSQSDRQLLNVVRAAQGLGLQLSVVPRLFDAINQRARIEHLGGLPLFGLRPVDPRGWPFAVKHALDRTVAGLAILMLSPVLLAIALAVRLSSPGPILYRQRRVGRDGCQFDVLKFRSMSLAPPSEFRLAPGSAPGGVEGDDRRTRVGRFLRRSSLDELPQLFNVLRGDMSLVGPRPERPEFVELFREEINRYGERHRVRSGITGWAQVNGLRGQTSIADRAEWDNYYIENWSLWLDVKILALTVLAVLRPDEDP